MDNINLEYKDINFKDDCNKTTQWQFDVLKIEFIKAMKSINAKALKDNTFIYSNNNKTIIYKLTGKVDGISINTENKNHHLIIFELEVKEDNQKSKNYGFIHMGMVKTVNSQYTIEKDNLSLIFKPMKNFGVLLLCENYNAIDKLVA